ncbi:hypothetical protein [Flavobacterium sp.]|uniref:hypothetical protein n=1 Tax=Flavobacterium sp. TaxID=239 RepID=UPI00261EC230|nr:hypothetical protein [Flavobacterium sp.]
MIKPKSLGELLPVNAVSMVETRFTHIFNPVCEDQEEQDPIHRCLIHPDDFKKRKMPPENRIWTLMDINGIDVLLSGYHYAKRVGYQRLGYVVSSVPTTESTFVVLSKALH